MNKQKLYTKLHWFWITVLVIILDYTSKYWIVSHLSINKYINIIPFIYLTYIYNSGIAFGFLANKNCWERWILSFIAILVIIILLKKVYHFTYKNIPLNIAYTMIIGGAMGNLFDRLIHGAVIDFICLKFGNWQCPIFNLADFSICIGFIIIILNDFFIKKLIAYK